MRDEDWRKIVNAWPRESDWTEILQPVFSSPWFESLQSFVANDRLSHTVYPAEEHVFEAFRLTSFADTKVVLIGQDPYHGPHQAHGLSFSVRTGCPLPPSLRNIFKELQDDLGVPVPVRGDLTGWARQGVLLLNSVLTVRAGQANSHARKGWETFTDAVIELLNRRTDKPMVFLLWGSPAIKKGRLISAPHTRIESVHPSPLSAYRGFLGSKPFSKANTALESYGLAPIQWQME